MRADLIKGPGTVIGRNKQFCGAEQGVGGVGIECFNKEKLIDLGEVTDVGLQDPEKNEGI